MRFNHSITVCLMILLLNGCSIFSRSAARITPVSPTPFLINEEVYPPGWKQEATLSDQGYAGEELGSIDVVFRYNSEPDNVSIYTVLWYESIESAKNGFNELTNHSKTIRKKLYLYDQFPYKSRFSQTHNMLCESQPNPDNEPYLCIFQARYGSYITMMSVHIDSTSMSIEDFTTLLQDIEKMFVMA
ncbi:MAG TPA: hypothetical protein VFS21_02200 [Roseiflexaceae bacterium]|nr:hypothetical protein [Roseiflexaceae bacterium]